jgi:Fe-S-cluster containining protein
VEGQVGWENPCVRCGACCAYFRVAFYWREAEGRASEGATPLELTEDLDSLLRCMKGTNQKRGGHCIALEGRVGRRVACGIYPNRPSPCRAFPASYENGKQNKRCDEARAAHGLKPLKLSDWPSHQPDVPDERDEPGIAIPSPTC